MESDEESDWIAIARECQDLEDEKAAAAAAAAPTPAMAQAAGASTKHRWTNSIDQMHGDVQVISPLFQFSLPCFICTIIDYTKNI
jgi:hypothetical protein